jgi:hypothetical protein
VQKKKEKAIDTTLMYFSSKSRSIKEGRENWWLLRPAPGAVKNEARGGEIFGREDNLDDLTRLEEERGLYWHDFCPFAYLTVSTPFMPPLIS